MEGYIAWRRDAVQRVATTLVFHILLVSFFFVLGKGVRQLFTEGLTSAATRFIVGGSHTLTRLSDPIERIYSLVDDPENLGFQLLGEPDSRVFDVPDRPTAAGEDPAYTDPSTLPTRQPDKPGQDPCPFPSEYREQIASLEQEIREITDLDEGSALQLVCHFRKLESLKNLDAVRLVETLSNRDIDQARPLLRFLLLTGRIRNKHGLVPEQIDDILRTWNAEAIARQARNRGWPALASMTSLRPEPPTPTATPTATAAPTKVPTETPKINETPEQESGWLSELFADQAEYLSCLPVQQRLLKAFLRYKRARVGDSADLDLQEMRDLGFLRALPLCPGGGHFRLTGPSTLHCTVHGDADRPWKRFHEYRIYFRPWEIARDTLEAGRPREAFAQAKRFLKRQPNHGWMLEVMGEAALELEDHKSAADAFYRITETIWTDDVWSLYQAGMAFYASGNNLQASRRLRTLLDHASWDNAKRRIATHLEYYRLVERARWVVETFLEPTENGVTMPPVRFLEYKVAREPEWPADICHANLTESRRIINGFLMGYYDSPALRKLYGKLTEVRRELSKLQHFEAQARAEAEAQIQELEAKIAEERKGRDETTSGSELLDLGRLLRTEGLPAHEGANYRVDQDGDLHCLVHPHLLEDAVLVGRGRTPEELKFLNNALSQAVLRSQDNRRICFQRQRDANEFFGQNLPPAFLAERVAASLQLETPAEADCPAPGPRGGFTIRSDGSTRRLFCLTHGAREDFLKAKSPTTKGPR